MAVTLPSRKCPPPLVLEYRLVEEDVRHYAASGRLRACGQLCRRQGRGMLAPAALGGLLFGLCLGAHGARAAGVAIGATLGVLAAIAWLRRSWACRCSCRLAREAGVPLGLRLTASDRGLVKDPAPDGSDPGRTFEWPEVTEVDRVDHLTVFRLRSAGSVLLIPDRAFADAGARERFVDQVRDWRRYAARS